MDVLPRMLVDALAWKPRAKLVRFVPKQAVVFVSCYVPTCVFWRMLGFHVEVVEHRGRQGRRSVDYSYRQVEEIPSALVTLPRYLEKSTSIMCYRMKRSLQ